MDVGYFGGSLFEAERLAELRDIAASGRDPTGEPGGDGGAVDADAAGEFVLRETGSVIGFYDVAGERHVCWDMLYFVVFKEGIGNET